MKLFGLITAAALTGAALLGITVPGDVNSDGRLSADDLSSMRGYILGTGSLNDPDAGELCRDGELNSADMCLMRRELFGSQIETNEIVVSNTGELKNALKNACAGDAVVLRPGIYECAEYETKASLFHSDAEGTADSPITIKSADPNDPAVLKGTDVSRGVVLYITGDFWKIENIICCNAQKGIVLDNSNYSYIKDVEVYDTGQEGIHLRDGSSECVIDGASVHDTGLVSEYGEAVYIGSAKSTSGYDYACDNNIVKNCTLGPNTSAESVDIKEYTTGNIIENCTMLGGGMTATDSFVDIKGNNTIVRNNYCDAQSNTSITDAFQVHCQVNGWGIDNEIYGNSVVFTGETEYIVKTWNGTSCTVHSNIRTPENSSFMYRAFNGSSITIPDE